MLKALTGWAASLALFLWAGAGMAADNKFVARGDAAKAALEQNAIGVDTAEKIATVCAGEAKMHGEKVAVAIYDQFGELVYFYRLDGAAKIAVDTAMMKAKTVLNTRQPSKAAQNQILSGLITEARESLYGNFANAGGLPIVINGDQFIGAIGVGGAGRNVPVWSDEICAWRALTTVIGKQPDLLPDLNPAPPAAAAKK